MASAFGESDAMARSPVSISAHLSLALLCMTSCVNTSHVPDGQARVLQRTVIEEGTCMQNIEFICNYLRVHGGAMQVAVLDSSLDAQYFGPNGLSIHQELERVGLRPIVGWDVVAEDIAQRTLSAYLTLEPICRIATVEDESASAQITQRLWTNQIPFGWSPGSTRMGTLVVPQSYTQQTLSILELIGSGFKIIYYTE